MRRARRVCSWSWLGLLIQSLCLSLQRRSSWSLPKSWEPIRPCICMPGHHLSIVVAKELLSSRCHRKPAMGIDHRGDGSWGRPYRISRPHPSNQAMAWSDGRGRRERLHRPRCRAGAPRPNPTREDVHSMGGGRYPVVTCGCDPSSRIVEPARRPYVRQTAGTVRPSPASLPSVGTTLHRTSTIPSGWSDGGAATSHPRASRAATGCPFSLRTRGVGARGTGGSPPPEQPTCLDLIGAAASMLCDRCSLRRALLARGCLARRRRPAPTSRPAPSPPFVLALLPALTSPLAAAPAPTTPPPRDGHRLLRRCLAPPEVPAFSCRCSLPPR